LPWFLRPQHEIADLLLVRIDLVLVRSDLLLVQFDFRVNLLDSFVAMTILFNQLVLHLQHFLIEFLHEFSHGQLLTHVLIL